MLEVLHAGVAASAIFLACAWKVFTRIASGSPLSDNGFRARAPVDTPATPTEAVYLSYLYLCYLCLQAIYL